MKIFRDLIAGIKIFFLGSISVCIIFSGSLAPAKWTKTETRCISCHEEVYKEGVALSYLHTSFKDKKCEKCHIKGQGKMGRDGSRWNILVRPEVVSRPDYLSEHTLFLRGLDRYAVYDISIICRDLRGNQTITELRDVIPLKISDIKTQDRIPPTISGVKHGSVVKKVFLESVISWDTDEPATGCVEFGLSPQYGSRTILDDTLKRHHGTVISGLEPRKLYHYRAISRDIRGNQSVSRDFVLSTSEISSGGASLGIKETENETDAKLALKRSEIFILGSDIGLYVETTKPANVTVEYLKVQDADLLTDFELVSYSGQGDDLSGKKRKLHKPGFRTGKELCIALCYECHPPDILGVSHPVGVSPKEGTKIPEDLPTLEGSIITCVTCHKGHGGNLRYFARKRPSRDICNSCHSNY